MDNLTMDKNLYEVSGASMENLYPALTQCFAIIMCGNDFAIGYPIVEALYKTTHPEYATYLYLMAPISLAILNPISFILMEIDKRRNVHSSEELLVLGSAFSASALFLLGLRMVGKVHKLKGATLVVPGILIMVKLIALPLVTREVISILHSGFNNSETVDLSTYGFLYGTFPSAPTVFVFATQYSIDVDLIASAMVVCTFVSAPLMFVSAKMITLTNCTPSDYIKQLDSFTMDMSIIGLIACLWVIVVFILTKKIFRVPHKITTCLIVSQLLSCVGAILWNTLQNKEGWMGYIQFSLFATGVYSSRLWTTILAVTLLFLQCRSLCYVLKLQPVFVLIGWGVPLLLSVLLLIFHKDGKLPYDKTNPNFVYGAFQAIIAMSLLVLCFIMTVGCLILHQRYRRRFTRYLDLANDVASDQEETSPSTPEVETTTDTAVISPNPSSSSDSGVGSVKAQKCCGLPTITEGCCEDKESPVVDIEDILGNTIPKTNEEHLKNLTSVSSDDGLSPSRDGLCPSRFGCGGHKREECHGIVQQYQQQINDDLELIEEESESHEPQILRHTVLLILLLCSMFVGMALSIWTLVMEQMSGIYVELSFLDATLNFGQSIIVFAIFGLDTKEILLPILRYWRKLWYGANTLILPSWHELSPETKHICDQFVTHHLQSCRATIAVDKRWRIKVYKNVFSGHTFVDWLIDVGLARDRIEAVNYARHLIEGKVLKHINSVYHFYDRNLLYTFV
ncbi:hypothetical protein NQ314_007333 [Rhamnusium bicolor]|uniref:DEP domain-containing protein n=1 Tax=Rhamnusium bicolor TaxID=1586634 RepID=A0AAV8YQL1_9CUCU|nr:hypothetical protein NQ314_007333 [Rhamnusium bicolor]